MPQCNDIKLPNNAQRRARNTVKGLDGKLYKKRVRYFSLCSIEKRRLKTQDLLSVYNFFLRGGSEADTDVFSLVTSDKT